MKVFTYGTLQRGFNNHIVMQQARGKFISKAIIKDKAIYWTYPGSFPVVIDGRGVVRGEIYDVPEDKIHLLDSLEGYSSNRPDSMNAYVRKRAKAYLSNGEEIWVSYYYWNRDVNVHYQIPDGNWARAIIVLYEKYNGDWNRMLRDYY